MSANNRVCSICKSEFELHFRYQTEELVETAPDGSSIQRLEHYCSQRCLEASHRNRADGSVACDACAKRFEVELASQVVFTGGRRHYACSTDCRTRVLSGVRQVRLGQLMDPTLAPSAEVLPEPEERIETSPSLPPVLDPDHRTLIPPAPANDAAELRRRSERVRRPASAQNPRVIAVFNHKGGTGKTTSAVHLAAGLAARGHRVLLVDADGQGNVGVSLGLKFERSLYHVLVMGMPFEQAVINARPNLDVLPANETLAAAELYLTGQRNRDRVFANRLGRARELYDYVVVDCSPSLSLLNQNALVMSDGVLCPVACDYLSLIGIRQVLRTLKQVNRVLGHPVNFWGVLPTMFDTRARICNEALETLRQNFKEVCLDPIHFVIRVKEAPSLGKTLFEYAPTSSATQDYWRVVDRLLDASTTQVEPLQEAGGVG
jgi:chromosome partitioning protein